MNTYSGVQLEERISAFRAKKGLGDTEVRYRSEVKIEVREERRSVAEWLHDTFSTKTTPLSLR